MKSSLHAALLTTLFLAACGTAGLSAEELRWCRTSSEALTTEAVEQAFLELHGVEMLDVMMDSYGFTEPDGAQIGSRMTVTNRGGFPDADSREAWFASDRYVAACRAAYTAATN